MAGGKGQGVVAAGHPLTAAAGAEILRQEGNAFDAAIAAVMTAWVTEPVLTSAGGGGFLLAHTATGENCLFDVARYLFNFFVLASRLELNTG